MVISAERVLGLIDLESNLFLPSFHRREHLCATRENHRPALEDACGAGPGEALRHGDSHRERRNVGHHEIVDRAVTLLERGLDRALLAGAATASPSTPSTRRA